MDVSPYQRFLAYFSRDLKRLLRKNVIRKRGKKDYFLILKLRNPFWSTPVVLRDYIFPRVFKNGFLKRFKKVVALKTRYKEEVEKRVSQGGVDPDALM